MFSHDYSSGDLSDSIARKLARAACAVGVVVFGILPLFFLPYVPAPLGYTKIVLGATGAALSLWLFAFSVLRQGSLSVRFELPILLLWLAALVAFVASLSSGDFFDSFWGTEISTHSGFFAVVLALIATLFVALGSHARSVIRLYLLIGLSAFVLAVFHLVRIMFGTSVLTFGIFGDSVVATPFSEWNSLGVFFGLVIILSLIALNRLPLPRAGRLLFLGSILISLCMLSVVNFKAVFVILGLVSLVMLIYALVQSRLIGSPVIATRGTVSTLPFAASLLVLLVSIVFVTAGGVIGTSISRMTGVSYVEVRPSLQATVDVARKVYQEHPFLGIGPHRFVDAWREHRDPSINATVFWNTDFQAGFGFIPTLFVTTGIVGGISWTVFLVSFFYIGIRTLLRVGMTDSMWYFILLSSFAASAYIWCVALIYVPGAILLMFGAACTGIFFAARRALTPDRVRKVDLIGNQRATFAAITATVLVVVLSVGGLYYLGTYYVSTTTFVRGVLALQKGENDAEALAHIVRAFEINRDDRFAREVANYEQRKLQEKVTAALQANNLTEGGWSEMQQHIVNSINSAKTAIDIDGMEPENWAALGRIYATAVPLNIDQAYELARESLEKARDLDPQDPSRYLALAELELLKKNTAAARELTRTAITLKSNYTDAMYLLTQIEVADGNVAAAIESTRATTILDPQNPVRFFQLGVLEYSLNRFPDAQASFERAVRILPEYSNAHYFLALTYDAQGMRDRALAELTLLRDLNPGNAEIEALLQAVSVQDASGATVSREQITTLQESSENASEDGVVRDGQIPQTPLLSPVNATESESGASGE